MTITCFVADDERLARQRLMDMLGQFPGVACVGGAFDGKSAIRGVQQTRPDLLFLDIKMPGMSGLEVFEALEPRSQVIFTTAHAEYAATAFDLRALDYLLKPFGMERLGEALDRAQSLGAARERTRGQGHREPAPDAAPLDRVFVRERGRIVPIRVHDILRVQAEGDYVMLFTARRRYLVSTRMKEFEARLEAKRFFRIHRSHIVNLDHVESLMPYDETRLQVQLVDGTRVVASRSRSKVLRSLAM